MPADRPQVGVIGPARRRSGTGPFVIRFLAEAGARVTAVAASSPASAAVAAAAIEQRYGHPVVASPDPQTMISDRPLDAVAICSPAAAHEDVLNAAVRRGLAVFCEKPLLWSGHPGDAARAAELVDRFRNRRLVLHHNTQWRYVLDDVRWVLGDCGVTRNLSMWLAPPRPGPEMYLEAVPHAVSVMAALGATTITGPTVWRWSPGGDRLSIETVAGRPDGSPLSLALALAAQAGQPRPAGLSLDGVRIDRIVTSMDPYTMALRIGSEVFPMQDPVRRSVHHFVRRLNAGPGAPDPLLNTEMALLEALHSGAPPPR